MKRILGTLLAVVAAGLAVWAVYLMVSAPPEPAGDWRLHMSEEQHALVIAPINHAYRLSAYYITWAIQLGYLGWMALRWQRQAEEAGV